MENEHGKEDLINRLRKIEGQIKGIEKMVEADKCCNEVLVQIAAVRAAINKVGGLMLENYSKSCIKKTLENSTDEKTIENLIDTIIKFTK